VWARPHSIADQRRDRIRLQIKGTPHSTTKLLPTISLTAYCLRPLKGISLHHLGLDEKSCRAIHDAELDKLILSNVDIPNVAALQLDKGGPRELHLVHWCYYRNVYRTNPIDKMLASMTTDSNIRCLSIKVKVIDFCGVLVRALRATTLHEFTIDYYNISMDDWKMLWEAIGASDLRTVCVKRRFLNIESAQERKKATLIVADAMRSNRRITELFMEPTYRDEGIWESSVAPYLKKNVLESNLNKLSCEPADDLRAALVGHLLHSKRDDSAALFQILTQHTDLVLAAAHRGSVVPSPVHKEDEQPNRRGRKRARTRF
jgi:hypothetical protein